ncbi:cupin domain-containing protein [Nocardioides panacisoli]|uniref:Cupin domain-containing protein n=1 Tax=Nocardioides panacisoli TaxID=627624 RepID=A0ABP7IT42_9ACTN
MPSANQATTPVAVDIPQLRGRYAPVGDYTVAFELFPQDVDPAPFYAGLPDDRCQCPHWGFVTTGEVTFRWKDHSETYRAGDAYYAPPGHLPLITSGTSVVEFSPSVDLDHTMAVIEANLARAGAGA